MQKRIQLNVIGAFMRKKIDVAKLKTVEASISCTTCRVSRKPYGGNDSSNSRCVFVGASNVFVYRVRAVLTRQTDISSVRGLVVIDIYSLCDLLSAEYYHVWSWQRRKRSWQGWRQASSQGTS